jgi:mycoredoxin
LELVFYLEFGFWFLGFLIPPTTNHKLPTYYISHLINDTIIPVSSNSKIKNITVYSTNWCGDCIRTQRFFDDNEEYFKTHNIPVEFINIDEDDEASDIVVEINKGNRSVPTLVIQKDDASTQILVEPARYTLENVLLS